VYAHYIGATYSSLYETTLHVTNRRSTYPFASKLSMYTSVQSSVGFLSTAR